jgi:SP family general alpha glucoside:H+ symporter-like MFS transporter
MWIPFLAAIVYFAPQSPWWLVRQERYEEAEQSVHRLTAPSESQAQDAKDSVAMMIHTTALERQVSEGATYFDCFRGTDRRRTEIVMMVFAMQQLSGQNLVGQAIQFLQSAGLSTDLSFTLNMVINAMFIIGTFVCWGCEYSTRFKLT